MKKQTPRVADRPFTGEEIRSTFTDFFRANGHTIVPSSSLVPTSDRTLLFTNSGMVQFKGVFLGHETRPYTQAASIQRCLRVGGKHNDLENVGVTTRHHTFFEMLGNFSFGDYFKHEAIHLAWQCLTETFQIPADKLFITVYEKDDEARAIWLKEIGIAPSRLSRCGAVDNFWSMGKTGPCGPCSEIYFDYGSQYVGNPPGHEGGCGERFVEIWNLVFTQYDRQPDESLIAIPRPSVDTGMGLERIAAVLQGVHNNYDTDMFQSLINALSAMPITQHERVAQCVVVDHIRAICFLLADGVLPGNEGRGYVLRRIIRRAALHGNKLGLTVPFLNQLVEPLIALMGKTYPELKDRKNDIQQQLRQEEERFSDTLHKGLGYLTQLLHKTKNNLLGGRDLFRLYDTYGFPLDLVMDATRECGVSLDLKGFDSEMERQRARARQASKFQQEQPSVRLLDNDSAPPPKTEYLGYDQLQIEGTVLGLFQNGKKTTQLTAGENACLLLDRTPFYAEAGGQVGDHGQIKTASGMFAVHDTQKQSGAYLHYGSVEQGAITVGDTALALVNQAHRQRIACNHSATHLLNAALRQILGAHVKQKGSRVDEQRLRFDFSHAKPLTREQLDDIEALVNRIIWQNSVTTTEEMPIAKAKGRNAVFLPEEEYLPMVRVLTIGDGFSTELCGGCHVAASGEIGVFLITAETGIASGVRRIEAETQKTAWQRIRGMRTVQDHLMQLGKVKKNPDLVPYVQKQIDAIRQLERQINKSELESAMATCATLAKQSVAIGRAKIITAQLDNVKQTMLRDIVKQLKVDIPSVVVVLASGEIDRGYLVIGVGKDCENRVNAATLAAQIVRKVGGKGGGRSNLAQVGGYGAVSWDDVASVVDAFVHRAISCKTSDSDLP